MNDLQWKEFIKEITQRGKDVNLKKICQEKHVGLNTLYRKVSTLQEKDRELYEKFISLHPYQPRDTQGIDFEQLMRESIIMGISQRELAKKYDIDYRTIQRRFAKIEENNFELYNIYQIYVEALKSGKELHHTIVEKVTSEYVPQQVKTEREQLEGRRKKFVEAMRSASSRQMKQYYKEEINRLEQQIEHIETIDETGEGREN